MLTHMYGSCFLATHHLKIFGIQTENLKNRILTRCSHIFYDQFLTETFELIWLQFTPRYFGESEGLEAQHTGGCQG